MKIVINGTEKEIALLYGDKVAFSYESIIQMSGASLAAEARVYCSLDGYDCQLFPVGCPGNNKVEIYQHQIPVFTVQ